MTNWIPCPPAEGGRLPTGKDCHNTNRRVVVQYENGLIGMRKGLDVEGRSIIAWQPLPAPYVVPPKPERRRRYIQPQPPLHCDVAFEKKQQVGPIGYWSLEHRSNDLDPDACREVFEEMEVLCYSMVQDVVQVDTVLKWVERMRRTNDAD